MRETYAGRVRVVGEITIRISEVVIDPTLLLRATNEKHVLALAERWPLDPILVTENLRLLDGLHRLVAAQRLGA